MAIIDGRGILVSESEEHLIPKGVLDKGESTPGTRTINAFWGQRARRMGHDIAA